MRFKAFLVCAMGLSAISCGEYELKKLEKCKDHECDSYDNQYYGESISTETSTVHETATQCFEIAKDDKKVVYQPSKEDQSSNADHSASYGMMGGVVGNGGDVLACTGTPDTTEMIDIFEARVLRDMTFDLGTGNTLDQKVELALSRLEALDPIRAGNYRVEAKIFMGLAKFLPENVILSDIKDSDEIAIPENCTMQQVVIQHPRVGPNDSRYTISKKWWDKLNDDNKAALILHEIIYHEALELGQKDSTRVRVLVGQMTSKEFEKMTIPAYASMMKDLGLPPIKFLGTMAIYMGSEIYEVDGKTLAGAQLAQEYADPIGVYLAPNTMIYFASEQKLLRGTLNRDFVFTTSCPAIPALSEVSFDKNGSLITVNNTAKKDSGNSNNNPTTD